MATVVIREASGKEEPIKEEDEKITETESKPKTKPNLPVNGDVGKKKTPPPPHLPPIKEPASVRKDFGASLLLSHVLFSPKVVNGSFAAFSEESDADDWSVDVSQLSIEGDYLRLSPRRRVKFSDQSRQKSLDFDSIWHKNVNTRLMSMRGSLDSKIDDILEKLSPSSPQSPAGSPVKQNGLNGHSGSNGYHVADKVNDMKPATNETKEATRDARVLEQESWDTGHTGEKNKSANNDNGDNSGENDVEQVLILSWKPKKTCCPKCGHAVSPVSPQKEN